MNAVHLPLPSSHFEGHRRETVTKVVSSVLPQTKTSAPRRTAAVNTSVSTPSGATAVSAGVALCSTRTNMTVKKVFHLNMGTSDPCSPLFLFFCDRITSQHRSGSVRACCFVLKKQVECSASIGLFIFCVEFCDVFLQLAVITLWTVWVVSSPAQIGRINTPARRHAPGLSLPLQATASKLYVPLPPALCAISLVSHEFICVTDPSVFTVLMSVTVVALPTMCGSRFCYHLHLCLLYHWHAVGKISRRLKILKHGTPVFLNNNVKEIREI